VGVAVAVSNPLLVSTSDLFVFCSTMDDPVEQIENYCPGGFHPVEIGDELYNGRYRILHRLGHGAFSTVWLAQNQLYESKSNSLPGVVLASRSRYVAIKILCAEVSHAKSDGRIMRQIPSVKKETIPGSEFVAALLDEFEIEGSNGLHRCMVMEVFGPSIFAVKECSEIDANPLPLEIARRIIVQCAKGLSFLHSHGIVHGGTY
jgi:serine/threonine-protein kinase SRPK3